MKSAALLAAVCATAVFAKPEQVAPRALFTIEVAPGETTQITEEERWELSAVTAAAEAISSISVTPMSHLSQSEQDQPYPKKFKYQENVKRLFPKLSWDNVKKNLEYYSTFHTRFSETETGAEAAQWLLGQVQDVVLKSGKKGVTAEAFPHARWPQNSVIARVQGRSNRTVVVGAHLDSINSADRMNGRAPGVDDDGSGSFLILEALRVLLSDKDFGPSKLQNSIEFHWYAAEEGGLRGSQDIFTQYAAAGRDIWAMLQQDMVGYTKATLDAGKPESFGLITDFTDPALNEYITRVIKEHMWIRVFRSWLCHEEWLPASFVFESAFEYRNPYIHTANDTMEHMDPDHVIQHGQLVLGYIYELGFSKHDL
ncbi:unnamed protein product [Alternaria alternata]